MKKLLAILVVIIGAVSAAQAASVYDSNENVVAGIIGTAGTGASYDVAPSKIFTLGSNFGQDIYKLTYSRTANGSSDLAVKRTLTRHQMSQEELFALMSGANIGKTLSKSPKDQVSPAQEAAKRQAVVSDMIEEKDLADFETALKADTEPTEFFSNGDESDSGFDLIADLDVMEKILFGKEQTVFGGTGPGAPPGSNIVNIGEGQNGGGNGAAGQGGGAGGGAQNFPENSVASPQNAEASKAEASIVCPANSDFNSAAVQARENEKKQMQTLGAPAAGSGDEADKGNGGGSVNGIPAAGAQETPIKPESPSNWSRPGVCSGTFCLKFEAIYKKASSYQNTDNCIACHFEKINDAFKKTLDHNLAPSKLTGNLLEGPKCKKVMLGLKWNMVLVSQPILTPPNDDLVVKGDFVKNAAAFLEKYFKNPGRCDALKKDDKGKGATGGACKPDKDVTQDTAARVLEQSSGTDDPQTVLQKIRDQVNTIRDEQLRLIEQDRVEKDGVNQASQYQVLFKEMDTMNNYFEGFLKLYNQIAPTQEDTPCQILIDKETCP